jgi:7-cyano-7-deazaguanine synthase
MLAELAKRYRRVHPVFIRQGLVWEQAELRALRRFLRAAGLAHEPLTILHLPAADLYARHWSTTGQRVPGAKTRDDAVYLPGRNLMLLSKVAVFCALHRIPVIAIGSLGHNPFPDATPHFFRRFAKIASASVHFRVTIVTPFRTFSKAEVVRRGRDLPLHLTFSCLAPRRGRPCGRCNKCAERRRAFRAAHVPDRASDA